MNTQNIIYALEIMGKGMASIFIVIGILTAIVVLLSKITNTSKLKQDNSKKTDHIILLNEKASHTVRSFFCVHFIRPYKIC